MQPFLIAIQGKGIQNAFRRLWSISSRYGLTPRKMDQALEYFGNVLAPYQCGASFPVTAAALARNKGVIEKYQAQNFEFAVHGFYHIDHSLLALNQLISDFTKARQLFGERGLISSGFRSPYLRYVEETLEAISESGFIYDSSSSLSWDVLNGSESASYHNVMDFYGTKSAEIYPSLPRIANNIVQIPYCLPDDESLIERLLFKNAQDMCQPWQKILGATYHRGELFTLGLHPERIYHCEEPLKSVLENASSLNPRVWMARLDEIARWWLQRAQVKPLILSSEPGEYTIKVQRIQGLTVLCQNVEMISQSKYWDGTFRVAQGNAIRFRSPLRPFVGVSPDSDPALQSFLVQQGYIVESTQTNQSHSLFLDRVSFSREDEAFLLKELDNHRGPLVRFGRWPNETKSALCVTGDIDAITIWDYFMRMWRK